MKQLEHEPVGDFEIEVLSSNEKSFIPSTSNITKLQVRYFFHFDFLDVRYLSYKTSANIGLVGMYY